MAEVLIPFDDVLGLVRGGMLFLVSVLLVPTIAHLLMVRFDTRASGDDR